MTEKIFKTLDEQSRDFAKRKGLIVDNEEQAMEILLRENYFFISGYQAFIYDERNWPEIFTGNDV